MLNYETILSSYDDKMTLMQWLKKVEEALKHASATAFRVNKKGNATISFILDFEDGTTLESGDIVLQQGESVNGAYIENNHLFITLTNGQVIDAGLMFNGNLTINGTLDATKVTGDEIVEKMSGYSFIEESPTNWTLEYVYASAVKTGNKVTFVLSLNITKLAGASNFPAIGTFTMPLSVYNKLYPTRIGDYSWLDVKVLNAFYTENANVAVPARISKGSSGKIGIQINATNMTENTTYYLRYEATFLLSNNLAGN